MTNDPQGPDDDTSSEVTVPEPKEAVETPSQTHFAPQSGGGGFFPQIVRPEVEPPAG